MILRHDRVSSWQPHIIRLSIYSTYVRISFLFRKESLFLAIEGIPNKAQFISPLVEAGELLRKLDKTDTL
jgi:hypothetical protein